MDSMGDRIHACHRQLGLSQNALAAKLRVSQSSVAAWEAEKYRPSGPALKGMAQCFGVSLRWLVTGQGERQSAPSREKQLAALVRAARLPLAERHALLSLFLRAAPADLARVGQRAEELAQGK